MSSVRALCAAIGLCISGYAATIGTIVSVTGGASDLILDEPRGRLYLVRPSPYNAIDVYSIAQRRILSTVAVDRLPLSAALSPDGGFLYVTCHDSSSLTIIDVNSLRVVNRVSLPAKPEGVAVGNDGRVLITTIGSGANNLQNTLLVYDPSITDNGSSLSTVPLAPAPPLPPNLPPVAGRVFLANRSQLVPTPDGSRIIGVNAFNANTRVVFVYDAASRIVTASRQVGDVSTVISVSPDGSKFMMGLRLFETDTLTVLAQQNAANATFPFSTDVSANGFTAVANQFNVQQNQGGSIFAPDGSRLYSAFNIAPVQNPAARPNVSNLLVSDPDNLYIQQGFQLAENLAGKMVISSDGNNIYALSESGILSIPIGQTAQSPIIEPVNSVLLLANDQCNVNPTGRTGSISIANLGRGQAGQIQPVLVQSLSSTNVPGLGGATGPGAGGPGGGAIINLPGVIPGVTVPAGVNQQTASILQNAPTVRTNRDGGLDVTFAPNVARALGTVPPHDYLIQSNAAVNIPNTFRVYQNNRESESRGDIIPVPTVLSPNEGLADIVADNARQLLYIANSGYNRVEVFDMRQKKFVNSIKVGQLPRSLAVTPDGNTLYVANTGGESISIIDLNTMAVVGRVKFPPIPFNGNVAVVSPSVIAATQRGLQIVMSNGTMWRVIGDTAVPRPVSAIIGTTTVTAPRTLMATPNGEYALLLDGGGNAYLYDSSVDDYVQRRQVVTAPIQGYYGPIGAAPRGQYFLVNGLVLNTSLSPINAVTGGTNTATQRPISAVVPATATTFLRFRQPVRANANATVTEAPIMELVDANTGNATRSVSVLEGPLSTVVGTQRVNVPGRMIAVDPQLTTAYAITTSGLSIVPLDVLDTRERPAVNPGGTVNFASYQAKYGQGGLITIFGRNLGSSESTTTSPLPTVLGGTCVTMNNNPMPLMMTSTGQINAQLFPEAAPGRYSLIIRSVDKKQASTAINITVDKYAPAVLVDSKGQASIYHSDGRPVTPDDPAQRDHYYVLYATGLGVPKGAKVTAGVVTPADAEIETDDVKVFFGDPKIAQSEVIVEKSIFAPGLVGIYQITVRVPGFRNKGDKLPVTVRIGNVDSPTTGPAVPYVAVE